MRLLTEPRGALCKQYHLHFDLNDAGFVMTEVLRRMRIQVSVGSASI